MRPVIAIVLALSTITASAGAENDAGSGGDAGGERAFATPVQVAKQFKGAAPLGDVDWYAATVFTGATCVLMNVSANRELYVGFGAERQTGAVSAVTTTGASGTVLGGLATPSLSAATIAVEPVSTDVTSYRSNITLVGFPAPSAGDAASGQDAGDIVGSATPVAAGCVGGSLSGVPFDARDMYSVTIPAGGVITYSFVTDGSSGLSLSLLDASGSPVAPTLSSGDAATFVTDVGGTFFLSSSSTSVSPSSYLVGITLGPGPGCRPTC